MRPVCSEFKILAPKFEQSDKRGSGTAAGRLRPAWRELDPALAEALRPALPGLVDEVIGAVETAVPEYSSGVEANVRLGVRQALDGFVELVTTGSDAGLPERAIYVEFGRGEFRVGRTLDALLTAYRAGAQVAWRGLADAGDAAGLDPRALYTLAEAIFAYIDEISAASAEGFAQEQSLVTSEREARRRRLLDLLLRDPPADADAVNEAALAAAWKLPERLAAVAFEADRPAALAARLPTGTLAGEHDGTPVALVPDPDGPGRRAEIQRALAEARAALGHATSWREAPQSAQRARLALEASDGPGLAVAEERLLDLLLLGDAGLAADLATRRLAPLDAPARRPPGPPPGDPGRLAGRPRRRPRGRRAPPRAHADRPLSPGPASRALRRGARSADLPPGAGARPARALAVGRRGLRRRSAREAEALRTLPGARDDLLGPLDHASAHQHAAGDDGGVDHGS